MNTVICIPFDEELAEYVGKKGSENSITFYNRKINDNVIVGLMPTSIEEKFHALPQSLLLADQILLSTKDLDKLFGEALIAAALLNKRTIFTKDNDISKLISGITLENIMFADRENILDLITSFKRSSAEGGARIDVDKAFNVKGIGTVALGIVTRGTVKVHDNLYHSSGKQVIVRSIQSQDVDIKEAGTGTRVGLALKGIEEEDMQKGDILSPVRISRTNKLELNVRTSAFVNEKIEKGKMYSMAIGFSYTVATVESVNGNIVKVKLEKSIPASPNDAFMMVRAVSPRIFASGTVTGTDY